MLICVYFNLCNLFNSVKIMSKQIIVNRKMFCYLNFFVVV